MATSLYCWPHQKGCDPTKPKTFKPDCPKCQALLAEGKRTGHEPHPSEVYLSSFVAKRRKRESSESFKKHVETVKAINKARTADPCYRRCGP